MEACRATVEAVVEGVVLGMVVSVCDSEVGLLVVVLNLGDEAAGKGGIVVVVSVVEEESGLQDS